MSTSPQSPMEGHQYDGIQELDNPLPRWWVYLFYLTIVFAVGYMGYYSFGMGPGSREALSQKLHALQPQSDSGGGLDYAALAKNVEKRAAGEGIYAAKCASCHAPDGGGLIGPNLTDAYWIHGKGGLADIIEVVKKGVPEKGMLRWEPLLSPEELQSVAVYVYHLKGRKPAAPKAPQGELIE